MTCRRASSPGNISRPPGQRPQLSLVDNAGGWRVPQEGHDVTRACLLAFGAGSAVTLGLVSLVLWALWLEGVIRW